MMLMMPKMRPSEENMVTNDPSMLPLTGYEAAVICRLSHTCTVHQPSQA